MPVSSLWILLTVLLCDSPRASDGFDPESPLPLFSATYITRAAERYSGSPSEVGVSLQRRRRAAVLVVVAEASHSPFTHPTASRAPRWRWAGARSRRRRCLHDAPHPQCAERADGIGTRTPGAGATEKASTDVRWTGIQSRWQIGGEPNGSDGYRSAMQDPLEPAASTGHYGTRLQWPRQPP